MKQYCKCADVVDKLRAFIDLQLRKGEHLLPGEPRLAEELGASRTTLRKALKVVEGEGLLTNDARGKLLKSRRAPRSKGTLCFVGQGRGCLGLHAWNRLWLALSSKASAAGWRCEMKLFMPDSPFQSAELEGADFIVYAGIGGSCGKEFLAFAEGRENVVGAQESHAERLKHVICLDDKEAGRMAARLLLEAGYRKPAFLSQDNGYLGFKRREEGFIETLSEALPGFTPPRLLLRGESLAQYLREYLDKMETIGSLDIDSLFASSDGLIEVAYAPISRIRRVPEDFGLVTLAGSYDSVVHQPPITAISHASSAVAREILGFMERRAGGKLTEAPALKLVKPSVHEGATVRKPEAR